MKTYICDFCKVCLDNSFYKVRMRELLGKGKRGKKEKIHICEKCWCELAFKMREGDKP